MDITVDELLENGKACVIKGKQFFKTESYVQPFIDRLKDKCDDFRVHVQLPSQYTLDTDGNVVTEDLTYPRVYIESVMADSDMFDNYDKCIGMVMGLDVRKPIVKFYSGALNSACTNLCVFSPSHLTIEEIQDGMPLDYSPLEKIIKIHDETRERLIELQKKIFAVDVPTREKMLGKWLDNSLLMDYKNDYQKVKVGTDLVLRGYRSLFLDENSEYYLRNTTANMHEVYEAMTQQITNERDKGKVFTIPEKTILIDRILNN